MSRTIEEISRDEWIAFEWHDTTRIGDSRTTYTRGRERPAADASLAAYEYDVNFRARVKAFREANL